jgi:hypothetical protein
LWIITNGKPLRDRKAWTNPEKRRASSAEAMQISTAMSAAFMGALPRGYPDLNARTRKCEQPSQVQNETAPDRSGAARYPPETAD